MSGFECLVLTCKLAFAFLSPRCRICFFIKRKEGLCGEIGQLQFIQGKYPADFQVKSRTREDGSIGSGLSPLVCRFEAAVNLISVLIV